MHFLRLLRTVLDFVLPTSCSYCKSPVGDSSVPFFCSSCWSDFSIMHGPLCPCCGRPFDSPEALTHSPEHLCRSCREDPPAFDQALSAGQFEGPLREAIHQFKYRPCRSLGKPLGQWLARSLRPPRGIDLVMPIPLHSTRLRMRGFNQSLLLARHVAGTFSLVLSYDNLVRIRPTMPQVGLSLEERIHNVSGAFALRRPAEVSDKSILLIDDVFTTGATINECSSIIKDAGAERVSALTAARAV